MEKETKVAFTLLAIATAAWIFAVADAKAETNNEVMKACLQKHGYSQENFYSYNFSKAAACHSDWRVAENEHNRKKQRAFLEENPWYRGSKWQWEETAEYRCEKIYSTALLENITVCSRPIYLN